MDDEFDSDADYEFSDLGDASMRADGLDARRRIEQLREERDLRLAMGDYLDFDLDGDEDA